MNVCLEKEILEKFWSAVVPKEKYGEGIEKVAVKFQKGQKDTSSEKEFSLMQGLQSNNIVKLLEFIYSFM